MYRLLFMLLLLSFMYSSVNSQLYSFETLEDTTQSVSDQNELLIEIEEWDDDEKLSFHMICSKSVNNAAISRLNNFTIGTNYNISSGLDLHI